MINYVVVLSNARTISGQTHTWYEAGRCAERAAKGIRSESVVFVRVANSAGLGYSPAGMFPSDWANLLNFCSMKDQKEK